MPHLFDITLIAVFSLVASFWCSLSEAAVYSVSRVRIETLRRQGSLRGRVLAHLRHHIDDTIAAILIVNTIANTIGAAWTGALVLESSGNAALTVFSAIFTAIILIFGEIVPKSIGVRFAQPLAPVLALPLQMLVWTLWPMIKVCLVITKLWGRDVHISHGSKEDIISLTQMVEEQGSIRARESEWVSNALRLDNVTAKDLMTPNPVVARVPAPMRLRDAKIDADHWRFSRIPVCSSNDPDKIVGVVRRRTVFDALARDEFDKTMGDMMEKAVFVKEDLAAHLLLDQFLKRRRHLFCVTDEADTFKGVVSLEDVLECLIGQEIVDETDLHENMQEVALKRKEALLARGSAHPNV
ncbi:TPA: hypothetical protein DDW35_12215 [Candidatus Sumerlaeota bacterium]|jgi:CBS domain containing-hemolysin-like protein|nr:hypothetical protein [Candidatus Sumerlaeota bacterium]